MRRLLRWFVSLLVEGGTTIICRIEKAELDKIPANGPLILAMNHIGSLEVPLLLAHAQPRRVISLAKIETWDNKFMGWLFDLWEFHPHPPRRSGCGSGAPLFGLPLRRGYPGGCPGRNPFPRW